MAPRVSLIEMAELTAPDATAMRTLGRDLAASLRPGDLVLLSGPLGAGKTTLAQGIGDGLGIRGPVTSPTFVIARVHPSLSDGPPMVHVDAYRISGGLEFDDLDIDGSMDGAVTVVEWGEGKAEQLGADRLEIAIARDAGAEDGGTAAGVRLIRITAFGDRWANVDLELA
jgi:tRNA threonylcarbamoyladenosine biosynthesis protein TsaE